VKAMARTPSKMIPLGSPAPSFALWDAVSGKTLSLAEISRGKQATVIAFWCNHCPFVKHIHGAWLRFVADYQNKGVAIVCINSNDPVAYPEDAPEQMQLLAREQKYSFPYLFDETQATARAFEAACTPDFYLYDENLRCAYRGQFDASRPGNDIPVSGEDLRRALDAMLAGKAVDSEQKASLGCNIKWRNS
jgi:thiol-disulfide isomerase/thioredoxin